MNVRYRVELSEAERDELHGDDRRRQARRAQAQAGADPAGGRCGRQRRGDCRAPWRSARSTVYRTKRRFVEGNLERR